MVMTPRERLLATARFEPVDRPIYMETMGFWDETLPRWHKEGLPPEINNPLAAHIFNGMEIWSPVGLGTHEHAGFDPLFDEEIIEQDERRTIKRDKSGSLIEVFTDGSSAIPIFLDSPVKDKETWEEVKTRLDPETPGRLAPWQIFIDLSKEQPIPLVVFIAGLFGTHRHLLGFDNLMLAYYDQPELIHEISRHWVYLWKSVLSKISDQLRPDQVNLWEDMCGKNGPIISPALFDEFMLPYYKELMAFFRNDLEIPIVGVDTDGDMTLLIPRFVEAKVNFLFPFEVAAGMDILKVREEWPDQFAIWGGIDKRALAKDKKAIEAEVMRVVPTILKQGGYIPCTDHLIPPDVPFDNWIYYRDLVREVGERYSG